MPAFVVFSDDWGEHPSSSQHIFTVLSRQCEVTWINTVGMRAPKLTFRDLRKIWRKLGKMVGLVASAPAGEPTSVRVYQPFMLPFARIAAVRRFNRWSVARILRSLQRDGPPPVVVTTVPNACDHLDDLASSMVVYYCVDDFPSWPGLDSALVRDMENRLIARADVLVATSSQLYEKLVASGKPTHLLQHGVDIDLFSSDTREEHPCLAAIPKPRVGYFGLFDDRSDQTLIAATARAMPEVSFVIAGPVETEVAELGSVRNVYFTGPISYPDLPKLIAGINVLFIAYKTSQFADALSPLKLKEYLVTGKPVVSTPIAEARNQSRYVELAETPGEWQERLSRLVTAAPDAARRQAMCEVFAEESWAHKAAVLLSLSNCLTMERAREKA